MASVVPAAYRAPMLHHVSFNARDPERAASVLAKLMDARAVRAPQPPFPAGSWFVVCGDSQGSLIELIPWGHVLDANGGFRDDPEMRPRTGSHVLASTPLSTASVMAIAEREGVKASLVDSGMFEFIKLWPEEALCVELLTPRQLPAYLKAFGSMGMAALEGNLRTLERSIAKAARGG